MKFLLRIIGQAFFILLFCRVLLSTAATDYTDGSSLMQTDIFGIRVVDVKGQIHRLGVSHDVMPVVVIFIDKKCPISARYAPELNELSKLAVSAGLQFYAVLSNPLMSVVDAKGYVLEARFDFPVVWDSSGDLALRLSPKVTPEVFVISPDNTILYRGRIDNRFPKLGVLRNNITQHDLKEVIATLGRGEQPSSSDAPAVGCFLEPWDSTTPKEVTYTRDIAPIVNANCVECHHNGGVAPFPLESYEQVKHRARMLAHVTEEGIMPPWRARKGFGEFRDERFLSQSAVFEIHYRPNGIATTDRSRMGLYFADGPVSNIATSFVAGTLDVNIAPEDNNYWRQVYADIPYDIRLIAVSPHMHYLGREVKAVATLPDGSRRPLLHIPDWDFRWQNLYVFRKPMELPAGSRIDAWFKFDNSSDNPYNPHHPPVPIRWGWSSDEEMCELWMRFTFADNDGRTQVKRAGSRSWSRHANLTEPPPDW